MQSRLGSSFWIFLFAFLLVVPLPGKAQTAPEPERQLRERVSEYFQLLVSGEWRKVQDYVAEESQDTWFAQAKNKIDSFEIQQVQLLPDSSQADVTVLVTFRIPQVSAPFHQPRKTKWLVEDGRWVTRLPPALTAAQMFGKIANAGGASEAAIPAQIPLVFDQNPILLPRLEPNDSTTIQVPFENVSDGIVSVRDLRTNCLCLTVEMDKLVLQPHEKATLTLTFRNSSAPRARRLAVQATLSPSLFLLDLPVAFSPQ